MRTPYRFNITLIIALPCLLISMQAKALNLTQALERAMQYDTIYQTAYAKYLAAVESAPLSRSALLPQIDLNGSIQQGHTYTTVEGETFGSKDNNTVYSLNLNQVIYNKTIFDKLDQGNAIAAKAHTDLETARQDTIIRVAKAYFKVLDAIDALETSSAEKKAIGKQLEQSKERYNVGLSAITDVKEQQASYDIASANEITATNNLSNAREALSVIINLYSTNLEVVRPKIPLVVPEPMDITIWKKKALENNYAVKSAEYAQKAAESAYDASRGGHYPSVSLNASYGSIDAEARDFSKFQLPATKTTEGKVILSLNVPLYSGGFTSATIRQKAADLERAQAQLERAQRTTIALVRSDYHNLEADIANVKARQQAVISTQTSLDATTAGYDAGTRTSVDVLLSQRLLYSSQRDYYASRYKYITDSLELKRVAGILTGKDIFEINKWLIPKPENKKTGK